MRWTSVDPLDICMSGTQLDRGQCLWRHSRRGRNCLVEQSRRSCNRSLSIVQSDDVVCQWRPASDEPRTMSRRRIPLIDSNLFGAISPSIRKCLSFGVLLVGLVYIYIYTGCKYTDRFYRWHEAGGFRVSVALSTESCAYDFNEYLIYYSVRYLSCLLFSMRQYYHQ